jgi:hypothetical protein
MTRAFFFLANLVWLLAGPLRADELHLKDGRILEGRLVAKKDGNVIFQEPGRRVIFPEEKVEHIVSTWSVFDEYDRRAAALNGMDGVNSRLALARWCHVQGMVQEMRAQVRKILDSDPECAEAHTLLEEVKVGGRWMPREEALVLAGWRICDGVWLTPEEVRAKVAVEAAQKRRRALEARINRLVSTLYEDSEKDAAAAYRELLALAREEKIANLSVLARELYLDGRVQRAVTLEVRLQQAQLGSIERRQISLGTGSPVTIELPRLSRVSLGTTVVVPVR